MVMTKAMLTVNWHRSSLKGNDGSSFVMNQNYSIKMNHWPKCSLLSGRWWEVCNLNTGRVVSTRIYSLYTTQGFLPYLLPKSFFSASPPRPRLLLSFVLVDGSLEGSLLLVVGSELDCN